MLAAELGLPYAFASHFAPDHLIPALHIYRSRFKPSEQLDRPYAMVGVNIVAAETDAKRGGWPRPSRCRSPISSGGARPQPAAHRRHRDLLVADGEGAGDADAGALHHRLADTVRQGMSALVAETAADELIIVSDVYEHSKRLRSFELIADAWVRAP